MSRYHEMSGAAITYWIGCWMIMVAASFSFGWAAGLGCAGGALALFGVLKRNVP